MYNLLTKNNLKKEIEKIIETAKKYLILVSPEAQLSNRYKTALLKQVENKNLEITILFGNMDNILPEDSIQQEDIDFFKQFTNIEVLTEKRLREKYYANESKIIFSSTKLPYVKNSNLSTAVLIDKTVKNNVVDTLNNDYSTYFDTILDKATLLFRNQPSYEKELRSKKNIFNKTSENKGDVYEVIPPNKNES